ncbi:MAG: hypothetical protein ACRD3W_25810, partial [Terriglobales bacterium]
MSAHATVEDRQHCLLKVCVLVSGMTALIYEIAWQRVLIRLVGAALPAVTMILFVFMSGMAIGSALDGMKADRVGKPLRIYAWLELALALYALVFPILASQSVYQTVLQLVAQSVLAVSGSHDIAQCLSYAAVNDGAA